MLYFTKKKVYILSFLKIDESAYELSGIAGSPTV